MIFGRHGEWRQLVALACAAPDTRKRASCGATTGRTGTASSAAGDKPKLKTPEQLDSLVAPIALYPDPLLAQVLAASTYPLEIVQAQRWFKANAKLTGENLTKAAATQPWDPSVQALVAFPDALKLLDENIQWTTDLGNAFLDQQSDVMDAVQRMRKKAKDGGKLESSKEQKVEVKTVETKTIVEIHPSDPQVIYVPTYNPTVVYGPPVYAYPPIVYPPPPPPPSTGAVIATAAVSFGVGVMMGAMWSGCCHGGYGWGCGWGGNNTVVINNSFNNRYGYANVNRNTNINNTNINGGNRTAVKGGNTNTWQHNPEHRKSVPYSDRSTAQRFGGTTRDSSGRTERFDRSGQPTATQTDRRANGGRQDTRDVGGGRDAGQSGRRDAASGQDRMGDRSIGSDSGRQSAFSGSESRARSEAASDRGFSSSRESGSGGSSDRSGARSSSSSSGRCSGAADHHLAAGGDGNGRTQTMTGRLARMILLAGAALSVARAEGGKTFATPEEARDALVQAAQKGLDEVRALFGPSSAGIVRTGDEVADKNVLTRFNTLAAEKTSLEPEDTNPDQ